MITDPDDPDYHYPKPGERLWHRPLATWLIIEGQPHYGPIDDEVDAHREDDGSTLTVKLRSLERRRQLRPCECHACRAGHSGHFFKMQAPIPGDWTAPDGRRICTTCDEPAIDNDYGAYQTERGEYFHSACREDAWGTHRQSTGEP